MTRVLRLVLAVLIAASAVLVTTAATPAAVHAAATNPIHPDNRPTTISGASNGAMHWLDMRQVSPTCVAYWRAAPSLISMLAAAHRDGVKLAPAECYRDFAGQVQMREHWCGQGACDMAAVPGTSNHGWGKAVDFSDHTGSLTFDSAAYAWLKGHAGWFGWNHPGVMEPGGSIPEPWHWEWVGDGGRMFPGQNFGYGNGFGLLLGGTPTGHVDGTFADSLNGWFGTTNVSGWALDPDTTGSIDVHVYVDGVGTAMRANKPRGDIAELFAGYDASPHGFTGQIPVVYGKREICAFGINVAGGTNALLNCVVATIGKDPTGSVDAVASTTGINIRGWALDADSTGSIDVHAYVNGAFAGATTANKARSDVDRVFPRNGSGHGFELTVPHQQGPQNVCLYGINTGPGSNVLLGCRTLISQRLPFGFLDTAHSVPGGLTVNGWALDPDTSGPIEVHTYIDNRGAGVTIAGVHRPDIGAVFPLYGPNHGYSATYATSPGAHSVCTYGINVGAGTNVLLGCKSVVV